MTSKLFVSILFSSLLVGSAGLAQTTSSNASGPVSYSSMTQLNDVLSGLEQASQSTQVDLAKLRIEKWKTDGSTKKQTDADVQSIQRNLTTAMPEIVGQLRNSPENLTQTFKLYRNLDALYDVFASVVESAGAFGSKDEFQSLQNDLGAMERSRHLAAERMEALASAKETELAQMRSLLRSAQATLSSTPPKKTVVDDTEPAAKPAKKKPVKRSVKPSTPAVAPEAPPSQE
jgi:hypothetical protein